MRERLALAFVGLTLVLLTLVGLVRIATLDDSVRANESDALSEHTLLAAAVFDARYRDGESMDESAVALLTSPDMRLTVRHADDSEIVADGRSFDPERLGEELTATQTSGDTTVAAVRSDARVRSIVSGRVTSLVALITAAVIAAAFAGVLLARRLSRPITQLARSATALRRGRYDIDLPQSRIPEVVALGAALQSSGHHLRDQIARDRAIIEHTSHVLRTPLTSLRLELEEVLLHDDLDDEVRRLVGRCLTDVTRLQETAAQIVDAGRSRTLVSGAAIPLVELATLMANRWRTTLPSTRGVRIFVDAGEDLPVTPGPVEQILDSVLEDVVARGRGPVTLRFEAAETHIRVLVEAGPERPGLDPDRPAADRARIVLEVLGGRWTGDALGEGLELLLPRR